MTSTSIRLVGDDLRPPDTPRRHLLSVADLTRDDVERLLGTARTFAASLERHVKKLPTLKGHLVINLFYESSTRTSSSFELAAKRLSADTLNIKSTGSSVDKGESLKDTALTLGAVSLSDSPLSTEEPVDLMLSVSADSRFAASSKLDDVRVEDS